MGKKRRAKGKDEDMMETKETGASWDFSTNSMNIGEGEGADGEPDEPKGPRHKKPTQRRNIKLRKNKKTEKAIALLDQQSNKIEKNQRKRELKNTLKKMY
ncbi:hypothetical protein CYMTET_49500 [Cymbomonas tetramitiformis]|uniref:Uncharacterized protein n=1 Tax=Cymbomonas tetramitiformis TaxID=36881 RepID=A0AAE0BR68_9CHLO|nr:hypothetical protein CYMTET_49500 [Cymbomonas tetramitiformis]